MIDSPSAMRGIRKNQQYANTNSPTCLSRIPSAWSSFAWLLVRGKPSRMKPRRRQSFLFKRSVVSLICCHCIFIKKMIYKGKKWFDELAKLRVKFERRCVQVSFARKTNLLLNSTLQGHTIIFQQNTQYDVG